MLAAAASSKTNLKRIKRHLKYEVLRKQQYPAGLSNHCPVCEYSCNKMGIRGVSVSLALLLLIAAAGFETVVADDATDG